MDAPQQQHVFEQLANKAKRAGLLRYHAHGILVIVAPEAPVGAPAAAAAPPPAAPPAPPPPPASV
jgi:hypothetical protein